MKLCIIRLVTMPFLLFFLDFILFASFERWIFHSLLMLFIWHVALATKQENLKLERNITFMLLLLQDLVLHGRFGFALSYLLPIWLGGLKLKKMLHANEISLFMFLFLTASWLRFFLKRLVFGTQIVVGSTIFILFCNITIAVLALKLSMILGMRGNRFGS